MKKDNSPHIMVVVLWLLVIMLLIIGWSLLGLFIRSRLDQKTKFAGNSMYPTIKNQQEVRVIQVFDKSKIKKGDIVAFYQKIDSSESRFMKRIIGVPKEKIKIFDGDVYVNGKKLDENYIQGKTVGRGFLQEGKEYMIPDGSLIVMGDNRAFSTDSRDFGFIKINDINGILGVVK